MLILEAAGTDALTPAARQMNQEQQTSLFAVFNEIGILNQLSRAVLEEKLPDGLIQPHFSVLNHLIRVRDGQTPAKLAGAFQVPKTSMSHTLAGLSKKGLVDMRPNPSDGRGKRVWITESGKQLRNETIAAMGPELAKLVQHVDADRLTSILPILTELRIYMDEARNPAAEDEG